MGRNTRNTHKEVKIRLFRKSCLCALCGSLINNMKESTVDHIIPLSRGGLDAVSNLQLAHFECNQKKGNLVLSTAG